MDKRKVIISFIAIIFLVFQQNISLALTITDIHYYDADKELIVEFEEDEDIEFDNQDISFKIDPSVSDFVYSSYGHNVVEVSNIELRPELYKIKIGFNNIVSKEVYDTIEFNQKYYSEDINFDNKEVERFIRNQIVEYKGEYGYSEREYKDIKKEGVSIPRGYLREIRNLYFSIDQNIVKDVSDLEDLSNIEGITIGCELIPINMITEDNRESFVEKRVNQPKRVFDNLDSLTKFKGLEKLGLCSVELKDTEVLSEFKSLKKLILINTNCIDLNVIKGLTKLEELEITDSEIESLDGIEELKSLKKLTLNNNKITNIEGLRNLDKLEEVNLSHNKINDISPIQNHNKLKWLDLSYNQIESIDELKNMESLTRLKLDNNKIKEIKSNLNLDELKRLDLSSNSISEIENLGSLPKLEDLYLSSNKIIEIKNLGELSRLESLDLSSNNISEIKNLEELLNLRELDLGTNSIDKIQNIENNEDLLYLYLNNNKISEVEGIDNLSHLEILDLSSNNISEIKNLDSNRGLEHLYLENNKITQIKGLDKITKLHELNLSNNKISSIENIKTFSMVDYLNLSGNQIEDIEALRKLTNIKELYLASNPIKDFEPVSSYYEKLFKKDFELKAKNENNNTSSKTSGSSGGGVSSVSSQVNMIQKTIKSSSDSKINLDKVQIQIPSNSVDGDVKIKIEKIKDSSKTNIKLNQKYVGDIYEFTKDNKEKFKKNITISLPFEKSKVDLEKYDLGVFWFDEDKKEWIKLENIKIDFKEEKISGDVNHFTKFSVLATEKDVIESEICLNDIKGHWAEENIKSMVKSKCINGYKDNTFMPDNSITRAEFCKMIVEGFKLEGNEGQIFEDTNNHWAKDIIAIAQSNQIVSGYDKNNFNPDKLITREEMAVIMTRALKLNDKASELTFDDSGKISPWAKDSVAIAVQNKILKGYPNNNLKPKDYATRAEAVTMVLNSLK